MVRATNGAASKEPILEHKINREAASQIINGEGNRFKEAAWEEVNRITSGVVASFNPTILNGQISQIINRVIHR